MHIRQTRFAASALFIAIMLSTVASTAKQQPNAKAEPFSGAVAEQLMKQVRDGLTNRNVSTVLAAFDPGNTPNYNGFSDQLTAFLNQWDSIRVYYQIVSAAESRCGAAECGTASVQFEMEAEDALGQGPAMHRNAQLQLTFQRGDKGWEIVNLTPRDLFQ